MVTNSTDNLGFLVHDAARLMRRRFEARASGHGLSSAQWRLLVRVVKEAGVPQARLAELLEIEPISVSRLLDRMEALGWVERRADSSDRRVRMIFPSAKASDAYAHVKSLAGEVYAEALAGLSQEARAILVNGLVTIVENLSDGETSSCSTVKSAESAAS